MKASTKPRPKHLSATAIARQIKRSPQGVLDALQRLGIKPDLVTTTGAFYLPSVIPQLVAGMRAANGNTQG